jgi:hypothetical protein
MKNWQKYKREQSGHNLRYNLSNYLETLRKTMKISVQQNWSLGQDLNPVTPKYKAGVLTTWS